MKINTKYKWGTRSEELTPTDYYCPNCGKKNVYQESSGDYYEGPSLYCLSCKHTFTMPSGPFPLSDESDIVND